MENIEDYQRFIDLASRAGFTHIVTLPMNERVVGAFMDAESAWNFQKMNEEQIVRLIEERCD